MRGREVAIDSHGGSLPAYAALPPDATRGVVVIHELLGRQPEIDRVVERFAEAGYAAVEPDLFSRGRVRCIVQALQTIAKGEGPVSEDIATAQRWLCEQSGLDRQRVGVIGFCLGGGLALAVGRRFGAVSTNYGDLPSTEVLRGIGPTIGCYGGRDRVFGNQGPRLEARLAEVGARVESHTYPTVGHSFLTDGEHPLVQTLSRPLFQIRWDPAVAEDAWTKIMAFFDENL